MSAKHVPLLLLRVFYSRGLLSLERCIVFFTKKLFSLVFFAVFLFSCTLLPFLQMWSPGCCCFFFFFFFFFWFPFFFYRICPRASAGSIVWSECEKIVFGGRQCKKFWRSIAKTKEWRYRTSIPVASRRTRTKRGRGRRPLRFLERFGAEEFERHGRSFRSLWAGNCGSVMSVGDIIGSNCHLQQGSHQHSRVHFW